jgi:hypothetical protein
MALDNILKPKSQNEIEDLEKRGFRKNAGKWRFNINIGPLIREYEESEDTEAFRNGMIELLNTKPEDINLFAGADEASKFQNIIDEFNMLDPVPEADELDHVMEMLYDWADDNDVWVESF